MSGTTHTYLQYYKEKRNLEITNLDQPLLENRVVEFKLKHSTLKRERPEDTSQQHRVVVLLPEFCEILDHLCWEMFDYGLFLPYLSLYLHDMHSMIESIQAWEKETLLNPVKNMLLLKQAFTHSSYANEEEKPENSNERLEFLGDAVLEAAVSSFVFHSNPTFHESQLANARQKYVVNAHLSGVAAKLGFQHRLITAKKQPLKQNAQKIVSDVLEAYLGALYLDQGMESAMRFCHQHIIQQPHAEIPPPKVMGWKDAEESLLSSLKEWEKQTKLAFVNKQYLIQP